jgi:methylated-DNA-[protein]-cysteine S-methyltransferase
MNSYQHMETPLGRLYILANEEGLLAVDWNPAITEKAIEASTPILQQAVRQLDEYFARQRQTFDLPICFSGTDFQNKTWQALLTIPYGETRSYADQANLIGHPKAVRAVGRTNGLNPIGIIVPCHRIIGKNGSLTGYAGGLDKKRWLLNHENQQLDIGAPIG